MASLLFGLIFALFGTALVEASLRAVGPQQLLEMIGAAVAFGVAVLLLSLAARAAAAALRWRRHRAQWRQQARAAPPGAELRRPGARPG